jgi:hypothetical protein
MLRQRPLPPAAVVIAACFFATGCFFYASESYRHERHVEHRAGAPRAVSGRVIVIVDQDWIRRRGPCDLYIDGRFYRHVDGRTEISVTEGEHAFEFRHSGSHAYSERLHVTHGRPVEIRPRFAEQYGPGHMQDRGPRYH